MAPYKRSDPTKLQKEREAIAEDQAAREVKPTESFVKRVTNLISERISQRRRRKAGYGPPPRVPGAMQHGFKEPDKTA